MKPLFIYYQSANKVCLSGETETVIQGCKYSPGTGKVSQAEPGEVIEETIDIRFEGSDTDIAAKLFEIEKYLEIGRQETIGQDWVYLRFYDAAASYDWKSRIVGGKIEYLNNGLVDRDFESQRAKITVLRLNYWAGSKRAVPCFDAGDAEPAIQTSIAEIVGHSDAAHKNYFGLCGHLAECDLPSPVELCFMNTWRADYFYDITLSERVLRGTGRAEAGWVEGEALSQGSGSVKTENDDVACSNAHSGSFAWNSTSEIQLATWAVTSGELAILRGQVQRGLMRLRTALNGAWTDIWLRLKILDEAGTNVLGESIWMLLPTGTKYIELPPIAIPPGLPDLDLYQPVTLAIYVKKVTGGDVSMDIDFIDFVPAETIRHLAYKAVVHTQGTNYLLVDSGILESTFFINADGTKKITHIGTGNYLMVYPGYDSIVHVTHRAYGDALFTLAFQMAVYPFYEPRRRNI